MKKHLEKKVPLWLGILVAVALVVPVAVVGLNQINDGYRLEAQTLKLPVDNPTGTQICYKNNSATNDYFVPTRTNQEFSAWRDSVGALNVEEIPCLSTPNSNCKNNEIVDFRAGYPIATAIIIEPLCDTNDFGPSTNQCEAYWGGPYQTAVTCTGTSV